MAMMTNSPTRDDDLHHMRAALALARRGLGATWPNPAVGCVIVKDGRVVGRGWTQPGGRPHAETEAIRRAGEAVRGATAYVTLEPCSHHGKTPPCAEGLIAAGISRCVVAIEDPDPRVCGSGIDRLRQAGIEVVVGPGADEAAEVNAGFFLRVRIGRPLLTLKTATTLDGRIATHTGESQWITGATARAVGHRLRAEHDAIMIGVGTALADNPMLTCRLPGLEQRSPIRIVFDSHLRLPLTSRLVATAGEVATWIVCLDSADLSRRRTFADCGVEPLAVAADGDGYPDLMAAMELLGRKGLTRVLVEGGAHLAAGLLRRRLVDRLAWFRAPRLMGGDGIPATVGFGVDHLAQAPQFRRLSSITVGEDILEVYARDRHDA